MQSHHESHQEQDQHQMMMHGSMWVHFTAITLGILLATSPVTFGYQDSLMFWNDIVAGVLIILFGALSIRPLRGWAQWANVAVGLWLLFAPLVFWSADPEAYLVDTTVGALVIALAILIPGMPGMRMMSGPTTPPGWSYNPSDWLQRAPVIALGLISFFISRYLAAHQLGYIGSAWDPFFGDGSTRILNSDVSKAWPISDAGFGATSYLIEALSGFMGGRNRWRTMPWMVLMFGILVIPLGITSIVLVILQPVMVGTWCTLCLITALFMLIMIPLAVDEIVAMGQFMADVRRQGKPFWVNFWRGGTMEGQGNEGNTATWESPAPEIGSTMVRGVNIPWTLLISSILGVWLMASPAILNAGGWAADSNYLFGPLVVMTAVIAMAEVIRPVRYLNIALGAWIIISPLLLSGATISLIVTNVIAGIALVLLSFPRGSVSQQYSHWNQRIH